MVKEEAKEEKVRNDEASSDAHQHVIDFDSPRFTDDYYSP